MINSKLLKGGLKSVSDKLLQRGFVIDNNEYESLEIKRKSLINEITNLRRIKKIKSNHMADLKSKNIDSHEVFKELLSLSEKLKLLEQKNKSCEQKLLDFLLRIPNIPDPSVPVGKSESDNVELYRWGNPRKFDFPIKDHVTLGSSLNGLDFKASSMISGSRFAVIKNKIATLHRALSQFMINTHIYEHGYNEVYVPYIVNKDSLYATGQLPNFSKDLFSIYGNFNYSLIPTSEVPLTNLVRNKLVHDKNILPFNFVANTPCFRSEAGSYGKDTRGLIRQHQFEKVEIVKVVLPQNGLEELNRLRTHAENILKKLNLPYRVTELCTSDIGFSSKKTYDLDVWIPSQNAYREVSSCSWCGCFQARRLKARFKFPGMIKSEYLHTLNGSGLAVGRTLVSVIENYQQKDGSILVPDVLRSYMNGISFIK